MSTAQIVYIIGFVLACVAVALDIGKRPLAVAALAGAVACALAVHAFQLS